MKTEMYSPGPVVRDAQGFAELPGLRGMTAEAFMDWLQLHGLQCDVSVMMYDDPAAWLVWEDGGGTDVSHWRPLPPDDDGWFIGSVHDLGDGPVCFWFRSVYQEEEDA